MTALDTGPTSGPTEGPETRNGWLPWLSTLLRLVMAGIWIAAGLSKIADLGASIRAVRAYRLLPEALVQVVGVGLPILELTLGALLLVGFGVRVVAVITTVLLLVYMAGITSAWVRGLNIDCGCFSKGGELGAGEKPTYGLELLRDTGFLIVAILLAKWPRGRFAVDDLLTSGRKEEA